MDALAAERAPQGFLHAGATASPEGRPGPSLSFNRHVSVCHELFLIREGEVRLETPDVTFELRPGHLLVVEPGVEHEELPGTPTTPYLLSCFHIDDTLAELYHVRYGVPEQLHFTVEVRMMGGEPVEAVTTAIAAELRSREIGWHHAVRDLLGYLRTVLLRRIQRGSFTHEIRTENRDLRASPLAEAALLFCRANLRQRLRLEEVAAAVGYSPRHLSRSFARHIGRPFSEQLRLLRMHVAAELLTGSDLSIAEIGEHVGYPTPAHFTRTFRRATGLSPRAYRRAPVPMSIA